MERKNKSILVDTFIQFIKFNIVGILNTGLGFLIYSLTVFLTDLYFLGVVFDYVLTIGVSFVLNKKITFKNSDKTSFFMVLKMVLAYVPSIILNIAALYFLVDKFAWNKYLAQIITAFAVAVISFLLQKFFVFQAGKIHREVDK